MADISVCHRTERRNRQPREMDGVQGEAWSVKGTQYRTDPSPELCGARAQRLRQKTFRCHDNAGCTGIGAQPELYRDCDCVHAAGAGLRCSPATAT